MNSFRIEAYENVITKHHLGAQLNWWQGARWAFLNGTGTDKTTICSVKQIDADTIEIVKRKDQNLGMFYRYFGSDQQGLYERVTVNRKEKTTAIDRMDANWWHSEAFLGRRDLFYLEKRGSDDSAPEQMTFVRHDSWIPKAKKFGVQLYSNIDAMSYKRAFKNAA